MENKKSLQLATILLGIVEAVILFIFGILICSFKESPNSTFNILVGTTLIIVAIVTFVVDIFKNKSVMNESAATNIGMVAIAIVALKDRDINIERFLAYFVITLGFYLVVEMVLDMIFRKEFAASIASGVIGLCFIGTGILFITNDTAQKVIYVIVGVILIILAILMLIKNILLLVLMNKTKDKKNKNVVDANVNVINEDVNNENKEEASNNETNE